MADPVRARQTVIHPTAVVSPRAVIGAGVHIGPYCIIGEHVVLHDDVELVSHVALSGRTEIGARTRIFPFASIGFEPQDLKYHGEPSTLTVGADCTIREHVTISPGTEGGGMSTRVGDHCLLMIGVHVGHDCVLGDHVILSNNAGLAGHCKVGDYVILEWSCGGDVQRRADRRPCLCRRHDQGRERRHPLRHGDRAILGDHLAASISSASSAAVSTARRSTICAPPIA